MTIALIFLWCFPFLLFTSDREGDGQASSGLQFPGDPQILADPVVGIIDPSKRQRKPKYCQKTPVLGSSWYPANEALIGWKSKLIAFWRLCYLQTAILRKILSGDDHEENPDFAVDRCVDSWMAV